MLDGFVSARAGKQLPQERPKVPLQVQDRLFRRQLQDPRSAHAGTWQQLYYVEGSAEHYTHRARIRGWSVAHKRARPGFKTWL